MPEKSCINACALSVLLYNDRIPTKNIGIRKMTTATFNNGITTEYKGNRAVKAAWLIVERESQKAIDSFGKLLKGYSLNTDLAKKSALTHLKSLNASKFIWIESYEYDRPNSAAFKDAAEMIGTTNPRLLKRKVEQYNAAVLADCLEQYEILVTEAAA